MKSLIVLAVLGVLGASGFSLYAMTDARSSWGLAAPSRIQFADSDGDGIPDYLDACPGLDNLAGHDSDGDGIRDECDLDPHKAGIALPAAQLARG